MTYFGAIELNAEETKLLEGITLDRLSHERGAQVANETAIPELMDSLLTRGAIPDHRLKYFNDPNYRSGRIKGSHRSLFERNGTEGGEIFVNYSFRKYLRYFLFGADLPETVISEFRSMVVSREPIGPSDAHDLGQLAKQLAKQHRLEPHNSAEEFFKLCLDCGIFLSHAESIRDVMKKVRMPKGR